MRKRWLVVLRNGTIVEFLAEDHDFLEDSIRFYDIDALGNLEIRGYVPLESLGGYFRDGNVIVPMTTNKNNGI